MANLRECCDQGPAAPGSWRFNTLPEFLVMRPSVEMEVFMLVELFQFQRLFVPLMGKFLDLAKLREQLVVEIVQLLATLRIFPSDEPR